MRVSVACVDAARSVVNGNAGGRGRFSDVRQATEARPGARRSVAFATIALLVALVASSVIPSAGVANAQDLRISHQFPAQIDSRDRAVRVFIEETRKRAPHLQLSLHPALSLGLKAPEQIDAVVSGDVAMCVYTLADLTDRAPEFGIAMMPFVPADLDMAARLKGTLFHKRLQSLAEANGLHILTWWWLPAGLASRQNEIAGPASAKGLSLRTPGPTIYDRLFELAGGRRSEPVAASEMSAALRAGKIDGVLMSDESLLAFRTYEQARHATFGAYMSMQPLLISKSVWDGLTIDEQSAMEEAADISDRYLETQQRDVEQKTIEAFTKAGAKVHPLNMGEYEAWSRIAKDTVWPEYRKLSPTADALFVALLRSLVQSPPVVR